MDTKFITLLLGFIFMVAVICSVCGRRKGGGAPAAAGQGGDKKPPLRSNFRLWLGVAVLAPSLYLSVTPKFQPNGVGVYLNDFAKMQERAGHLASLFATLGRGVYDLARKLLSGNE